MNEENRRIGFKIVGLNRGGIFTKSSTLDTPQCPEAKHLPCTNLGTGV